MSCILLEPARARFPLRRHSFGRGVTPGKSDYVSSSLKKTTGPRAVQKFKVVFRMVCVFRVRVWKSYKTHRSSGYGYDSLTELTEFPGTGMEVLQNSPKFRAGIRMVYPHTRTRTRVLLQGRTRTPGIVPRAYRTYRIPGTGMNVVHNSQKFRYR